MNTVRFSQVVSKSGKPEPYTLWANPKKDAEFQRNVKQHRVMTVHQETVGTKADYGEVGFKGDRQAQLLVFPKSLKPFEGKRVIGVKYDLLESPPTTRRAVTTRKTPKPKKPSAPKPKPEEQKIVAFTPLPESKPVKRDDPLKSVAPFRARLRRAMKALEAGKAVQAYQMLQQLDREMAKEA
ncbi:MAG: hypothetical protein QOE70_1601 [Chthoniobacter sp.]|jgi:hypothetical protein|nr:hypothetical protein [Chthoniobacter sp.]